MTWLLNYKTWKTSSSLRNVYSFEADAINLFINSLLLFACILFFYYFIKALCQKSYFYYSDVNNLILLLKHINKNKTLSKR